MYSSIINNKPKPIGGVYLFMNARDEPSIREWVAHHLLLGFTRIIIFDHKSIIPISSIIKHNNVTIIPTSLPDGNVKKELMNAAFGMAAAQHAEWMIYLDADEYIYIKTTHPISQILKSFRFADAVSVNWLVFGTSGHIGQPSGSIVSNFIRSDLTLNHHVKTFVRPQKVISNDNPHYYKMVDPNRVFHISNQRMAPEHPFFEATQRFDAAFMFVAHYMIQSEQEFRRRKGRQMDDGTITNEHAFDNIHSKHNECENTLMRDKYAARIDNFAKRLMR